MPVKTEAEVFEFRDWVYRLRPSQVSPGRLLVMLHGWTGDENSMWVFTQVAPARSTVLAPRAPDKAPQGGYTWREVKPGTWGLPGFEDLRPAAVKLVNFIDEWALFSGVDAAQFDLMGFSQGAALSYVITLLYPVRVRLLAALSGFLPRGAVGHMDEAALAGKPVFVAHGRQDEMVPVSQARAAVKIFEGAGARISFCETEGGHKVSRDCMKGLKVFFQENDS